MADTRSAFPSSITSSCDSRHVLRMRPVPPPELPCTFLPDDVWAAIAMSLGLSKREAEIAALIMRDETERAMAGELGMSAHTVHTHLERLYRKLNARSRSQVVVRIFQRYVQLESGRSRGERVLPHRRAPELVNHSSKLAVRCTRQG